MPMAAFGSKPRWFGDDEEDGPTPLFPPGVIGTEKQSMFPVKSDASPVLGALKSGWKGLGDWLQAPASSEAGSGDDLLGYKPTSRISAIGAALTGAAKGVMGARGPYSNWFGEGLLGAGEGLEASRKQDLRLRQLAQEQQYKSAAASLATMRARTAERQAEHAGEFTIGRTRFDPAGKAIVTAPPEEMSEADKARLAQGDERLALDRTQADAQTAFRQQELALRKGELAHKGDLTPYQQQELKLAQERLGLTREEMKQKQSDAASAADAGKSASERDRNKLVTLSSKLAAGQELAPEEKSEYERLYRETAQAKTTFDPATGQTTTVNPDIGDLARPPSMAAAAAPAPGATTVPTQFPRAQAEDATKTWGAYQSFDAQAGGVQELLKDMSPGERMNSDKASRIEMKLTPMISAIAALGNSGVVSPTEAANYEKRFGDLTGPTAAGKLMLGIDRAQAALDEGRKIMRDAARAKALPVGSAAEAKTIQKGTPFVLNGHVGVSLGDGKVQLMDED